jgi:hypothetical protein
VEGGKNHDITTVTQGDREDGGGQRLTDP